MVDFLFTERGKRPGHARIERGLAEAVRAAGLTSSDSQPLHVTAHQLRHCYATALANAGMSIQGLMALLGHTTPEMTLRYATLASPTLHPAYETAMGRMRPRLPIAPVGKPIVPDRVAWLASEILKTRVAHGYCARELAAEACPHANICETCENFLPAGEFLPALRAQITDVHELRDDAATRGWDSEVARHQRWPGSGAGAGADVAAQQVLVDRGVGGHVPRRVITHAQSVGPLGVAQQHVTGLVGQDGGRGGPS